LQKSRRHQTLLGRITGLDPSGPGFQGLPKSLLLSQDDAAWVDVYHTNMGLLGYAGKIGHVDFYRK
jgi:hypothetical protein